MHVNFNINCIANLNFSPKLSFHFFISLIIARINIVQKLSKVFLTVNK